MAIEFTDTNLATAEPLKAFQTVDDLGKSYAELHGKVTNGDISILPEDLRKDPTIANYKNVNEVAKALVETKKLVGQIKKAPENPDGYKFTQLQNLHQGLTNVGETQKTLAQMFHKAGLDNEKADQLQQMILSGLSTGLSKNEEARKSKSQEMETKLRQDWGANYDKNLNNVKNVMERAGLKALAAKVNEDPETLVGFHKLTSLLSEDSIGRLGESASTVDTKTREGSQKRIKEIMDSSELRAALADEKNPKHKDVKKEWMDAHATAFAV